MTCGDFFDYETPKQVHVKSKFVGVLNRLIEFLIIAYICGFAILYQRGYQDFDNVVSGLTTKVKGVVYSNISGFDYPELNQRIYDVVDYVNPPQENDAFFVMTNLFITPNQTQGTCDEDPGIYGSQCNEDSDCPRGDEAAGGNGVFTGRCINSSKSVLPAKHSGKVCEIYSWCPVELYDIADTGTLHKHALLEKSKHFTVLIKNHVGFPRFSVKQSNIRDFHNETFLKTCRYNRSDPIMRTCPIFELETIINEANQIYETIAIKGGVISINIHWDCNLDEDLHHCMPAYSFSRLDNPDTKISKGLNFRYGRYYSDNGVDKRDLIKAYGIRFIIKVTGRAGKFSIVPLLLNIGSGIGLLAVSTMICDIVLLNLLRKGSYYKLHKYTFVDEEKGQALSAVIEKNNHNTEMKNGGVVEEVNEMPIQFAKYAKYGTADEWNSPQEIEWYGTKNNEPINRV